MKTRPAAVPLVLAFAPSLGAPGDDTLDTAADNAVVGNEAVGGDAF